MISEKTKYNIKQIGPFAIIWVSVATIFLLVEHLALGSQKNALDTAIRLNTKVVVFALTGIAFIGLLFGIIETFVLKKLFRNQSFVIKIFGKLIIYLLFFLIVILITFPIAASIELEVSILDKRVWDKYSDFFFSITNLSATIQLGFSLLLSLFYSEISDNLGQNVIYNFFTGKYHKPVEEKRLFMFVDMKDSTAIAEKLGHKQYFLLLRDYYQTFSNVIIKYQGEVYQYVGDEIVITWHLKNGIKNNNCVKCFFDMKTTLNKAGEYFKNKYNIIPDFKAALHGGLVTTGEIGALKKDIFFTGDVLNTTSRILSFTSEYNEDFLISESTFKHLNFNNDYIIIDIGKQHLKGKINTIKMLAIQKK